MLQLSNKALTSHLSPIRKFFSYAEKARERGIKIYSLNIGQPDIETQKSYFDAIKNCDLKIDSYAPSLGMKSLLNAVANYYHRMGIDIDESNIVITNGGSEAILQSAFCIINEGDSVLIPEPFYPNYHTIVKAVGGNVLPLETFSRENYFYADKKRLEKAIEQSIRFGSVPKAMIITNPNNPTGTILDDSDMQTIIDLAIKYDMYIICDEVYREINYTNKPIRSILQYKGAEEHSIVIDSVSKRFSCCGARIGALITRNKKIIENATKFSQARLSVSTLNQIGATSLYNNTPSDYFNSIKDEYKKRCSVIVEGLNKIEGVYVSPPKGAFYIMATLPVDDSEEFLKFLLNDFSDNRETLMYSPAKDFYASEGKGKNEIRLAAVLCEKDLKRSMEILKKAIEKYNSLK